MTQAIIAVGRLTQISGWKRSYLTASQDLVIHRTILLWSYQYLHHCTDGNIDPMTSAIPLGAPKKDVTLFMTEAMCRMHNKVKQ